MVKNISCNIENISDELWEEAVYREKIIRPLYIKKFLKFEQLTKEKITRAAGKLGLKKSRLYTLINKYAETPQTSTLIPFKRGWEIGKFRLTQNQEDVIQDQINNFYLNRENPPISSLSCAIS